ncbi:MAG: hypothetical protein HDT33_01655 [Clostridiales bacterium]|nr:hypothetical protein [Clostridiales bacterium]
MDVQMLKKMAAKCKRKPEIASAGAFLLVGVDRDAIGMGDGGALIRAGQDSKWKVCVLNMFNCDGTDDDIDVIVDDDLYDDEPDEDELWEEQKEAADCQLTYFGQGANVRFHAHENRTGDGLRIKEDFASVDRGDGEREIPIVYWNTGRSPVKVDGAQISPGECRISFPDDASRVRRRALKQEQDKCLTDWVKRYSEEQKQAELDAVTEQIMELKPDWTEEQAHIAARMFLNQKYGRNT